MSELQCLLFLLGQRKGVFQNRKNAVYFTATLEIKIFVLFSSPVSFVVEVINQKYESEQNSIFNAQIMQKMSNGN